MTFGSLFAGIGGFDLGFERAGLVPKWQVEIDPFCRAVLAKHWPDVRRYEDVRTVGAHNLERVDVLCGGFPCQDISVAGRGAGIEGARSGLWAEFDRLIGELRPGFVVVENVSALLARGLGRVLGDLAARGYDAEWDCLPASAFGAPHQRDRIWIIADASTNRLQERGDVACVGAETQNGEFARREAHRMAASPIGADAERGQQPLWRPAGRTRWFGESVPRHRDWPLASQPVLGRGSDGLPNRLDRLKGLGNAVVPDITEWIGRRLMSADPGSREE